MKVILCQPAIPRFQWELEVLLTNMRQFGKFEVVLLFTEKDFTVPGFFRKNYPECGVFVYTDTREDREYLPNKCPWLLWQYLRGDPAREQETYIYLDADTIFREWPKWDELGVTPKRWAMSDCSSYIGYKYLSSREKGAEIASMMAEICGISLEQLKNTPGGGAQLVICNPTAAFWERTYYDSNKIYHYFKGLDSNIQKWTAEMWAQLYGMTREGIQIELSPELAFCRPTDLVEKWDQVKIFHNAGVHAYGDNFFFKGLYDKTSPIGMDLSWVRKDRATIRYVEAIQKVIH